jgi:hypothetical protein
MDTNGQVQAPAALLSGKKPFIDRRGGRVNLRCDLDILEMTKNFLLCPGWLIQGSD